MSEIVYRSGFVSEWWHLYYGPERWRLGQWPAGRNWTWSRQSDYTPDINLSMSHWIQWCRRSPAAYVTWLEEQFIEEAHSGAYKTRARYWVVKSRKSRAVPRPVRKPWTPGQLEVHCLTCPTAGWRSRMGWKIHHPCFGTESDWTSLLMVGMSCLCSLQQMHKSQSAVGVVESLRRRFWKILTVFFSNAAFAIATVALKRLLET